MVRLGNDMVIKLIFKQCVNDVIVKYCIFGSPLCLFSTDLCVTVKEWTMSHVLHIWMPTPSKPSQNSQQPPISWSVSTLIPILGTNINQILTCITFAQVFLIKWPYILYIARVPFISKTLTRCACFHDIAATHNTSGLISRSVYFSKFPFLFGCIFCLHNFLALRSCALDWFLCQFTDEVITGREVN